jgi:hypothetical protein
MQILPGSCSLVALLRKIPQQFCNACFLLLFVVSGLRRFGRLFSAARAVLVVVFSGLTRFGFVVFSGSRRFGPLFSAACAVSVPFCFLSITLIPVAFAVVLFVYRTELPVLFSLSEDSPDYFLFSFQAGIGLHMLQAHPTSPPHYCSGFGLDYAAFARRYLRYLN